MTSSTKALAVLCIVTSLIVHGCATSDPTPPSRSEMGTLGIAAMGRFEAPEALGPIGPDEEVGRGAWRGAGIGVKTGAVGGFAAGLVCGPWFVICSPIGMIAGGAGGAVAGAAGGAIVGGANALPEETAAEIEAALGAAIAERDLSTELAERVYERAGADGSPALVNIGTVAVPVADTIVDYNEISGSQANTVLQVGIVQYGLTREERGDAPFSLLINAQASLIRTSDNEVLWSNPQILMVSPPAELAAWTAPGANLLQTEIDTGLERLALRIYGQVFSST